MDLDVRTIVLLGLVAVLMLLVLWGALFALARRLKPGLLRDVLRFVPACFTTIRRLRGQPIATKVKVILVLALVWLISPLDPVPDFLPIIGTLDDIIVALSALRYAGRSLDRRTLLAAWPETAALLQRFLGKP